VKGGIVLRGRDAESAVLGRLFDAARSGESGAVVVRGEPGIGKTALVEYAIGTAPDLRLLRAVGVQSEIELAFAGLHQLCGPLLDRLDRLPDPQRQALSGAFGISDGEAPDRFVVGLAALNLLSDAAEGQPLLCAVDDAQWLDEESALTLAFVARRLLAESVAIVFVTRERNEVFSGLPELVLDGLDADDAHSLLATGLPGLVDEQVRDRIVAETRGNPLALLELPHGRSAVELAGGFGVPDDLPLADRIEQSFLRRIESLRAETRRLLLAAAAEPVGDVALLWRAAERLGLRPDAAEPAETAGLVEFGVRVRFRHPLVRSAAYRAAAVRDRREVHRALAGATDPAVDPDRRAWHRAQAAAGPDEEVASELERSADRARARGGFAAMAAFLERAAALTPDLARRGTRALSAARAKLEAGAPEAAQALLATAELSPLDDLEGARLERLRGQIAFARTRGNDAPPLLLEAARRFEPLDVASARETYVETFGAEIFAGRESRAGSMVETAKGARASPPGPLPPRPIDLLLDGLAARFTEPLGEALPALTRALNAFADEDRSDDDGLRWLWTSCPVTPEPLAPELWDDERWHALANRAVDLARNSGALAVLPIALSYRACVHVHAGEFATATALIQEANAISRAVGNAPLRYTSLVLVAWRGDETAALPVIESSLEDAKARGEGRAIGLAHYATAVLFNGLGRYEEALAAAERACAHEDLGFHGWALAELVEAGSRNGARETASSAMRRLAERTRASGTDWALGVQARSEALLSEGDEAEGLYREAVERLGRSRITVHLARAQLVYGEWLRRENRRVDAREQLRAAHERFSNIGADAFAERARREVEATGGTAHKRSVETRDDLTPQEAQIAGLARDGLSNPEIGAQLFISPRTVQYHLHKVFAKLDITSRNQLAQVLTGKQD
jgi:DNA-binding CsgD family transcriptional regulator/tetratricopeptide (TPR) repeat protein